VGSMIPRSQKTLVAVGLSGAPWRSLTLLLKRSERSYKPGVAGSKPARSTNKIKGFLRFDALGDLTARNHSHHHFYSGPRSFTREGRPPFCRRRRASTLARYDNRRLQSC
jgi:hypothetical protein